MQRRFVFLSLVLLLFQLVLSACGSKQAGQLYENLPDPPTVGWVRDDAKILSKETLKRIQEIGDLGDESGQFQIAVYVSDSCPLEPPLSLYAAEVFNHWGVGHKDDDDGVLLVVCTNRREMWITPGAGIQSVLTDSTLARIRDKYFIPNAKKKDLDSAVRFTVEAIAEEITGEEFLEEQAKTINPWVILIVLVVLLIILFLLLPNSDGYSGSSGSGSSWSSWDSDDSSPFGGGFSTGGGAGGSW